MAKAAAAIFALAFLAILTATTPAIAVGPTQAPNVGKNPNVFINPANHKTALNTPNGDQSALDRITWYGNQIILYFNASNVKGVLNNALIADIDTVKAMNSNPGLFENKWIYLSGENSGNAYDDPNDVPNVGSHGMFYWWIRSQGFSHEAALASIAARNPDGGLAKFNYIGPE